MSDKTDGPNGPRDGKDSPPDVEVLAKRYMDLWGKHMSSMAADPSLAEALSKTMGVIAAAAKAAGSPSAMTQGMTPNEETPRGAASNDGGTAGSPTTGLASGPAGADLGGMAERIDTLERRVALLEAALGGLLVQSGKS